MYENEAEKSALCQEATSGLVGNGVYKRPSIMQELRNQRDYLIKDLGRVQGKINLLESRPELINAIDEFKDFI